MVADKIYESVRKLPDPLQAQVLDFVEYLLMRAQRDTKSEHETTWMSMSVDLAMRGMEGEDTPGYSTADLKEQFP